MKVKIGTRDYCFSTAGFLIAAADILMALKLTILGLEGTLYYILIIIWHLIVYVTLLNLALLVSNTFDSWKFKQWKKQPEERIN